RSGTSAARAGSSEECGADLSGPAKRELHDVGVAGVEGRLAVRQIELPDPHEALVEADLAHARRLAQEARAPMAQGAGVVRAKGELGAHLQARARGLCLEGRDARQQSTREDVLLD